MRWSGVIFMIVCGLPGLSAFAYDWNTNPGNGSADTPYQISDPNQLAAIGSNPDLLDKHFILMNDLVFDPNNNPTHIFERALIAPDFNHSNKAFDGNVFKGSFNGKGYKIINITILSPNTDNDCLALIGYASNGAHIENLALENVSIYTSLYSTEDAAGLCGGISNATIINCSVTGKISGGKNVGGLIGHSILGGYVDNCSTEVSLTGASYVGGICGRHYSAGINNCHSNAIISTAGETSSYIGGLCGWSNSAGITNCISIVTINQTNNTSSAGGLIGKSMKVRIWRCFSNATIIGNIDSDRIGGLIGDAYNTKILRSYAQSQITGGGRSIGGLCGSTSGGETVIDQCYVTGNIHCIDNVTFIGGFCGANSDSVIENSYSSTNLSAINGSGVGGFCGYNYGYNHNSIIVNCYTTGKVYSLNNPDSVGGFCGKQTGNFAKISDAFWILENGGSVGFNQDMFRPGTIVNVYGKTSEQLKHRNTFTESPSTWDFVGETTNGENDVWRMCVDGVDYPHLSWEYAQNGDFACGDGVDILDLQALAEHWLLTETSNPAAFSDACDADGDGVIGLTDVSVLGSNW